MKMKKQKKKKWISWHSRENIAVGGLMTALAFIFSYVEILIPFPIPIPGVKLGLANLVIVTALYVIGVKEAVYLSIVRICLVALTFGNISMMMFSLSGCIMSLAVMIVLKKSEVFTISGVSLAGGVMHNVGQLFMAMLVLHNRSIMYYIPLLLVCGAVTGQIIGVISKVICRHLGYAKKAEKCNADMEK